MGAAVQRGPCCLSARCRDPTDGQSRPAAGLQLCPAHRGGAPPPLGDRCCLAPPTAAHSAAASAPAPCRRWPRTWRGLRAPATASARSGSGARPRCRWSRHAGAGRGGCWHSGQGGGERELWRHKAACPVAAGGRGSWSQRHSLCACADPVRPARRPACLPPAARTATRARWSAIALRRSGARAARPATAHSSRVR